MREFTLHLKRWMVLLLERKDRLSMCNGLEVPYTDHELVEYVYNVPWSIKSRDGEEKWLLKRACADYVPEAVLKRRKSPYPTSANLGYERFLRGSVRRLLEDAANPVFGIVSREFLAAELEHPEGYFNTQVSRHNLETALALEGWLRVVRALRLSVTRGVAGSGCCPARRRLQASGISPRSPSPTGMPSTPAWNSRASTGSAPAMRRWMMFIRQPAASPSSTRVLWAPSRVSRRSSPLST